MIVYPPSDDPLLMAGVIRCRRCGRVAFPVEAEWLDEIRFTAVYPRPCSHAAGAAVVIDLTGLDQAREEAPGRDAGAVFRGDLSLYVKSRRCAGSNRKGRPCRSYAAPGSRYCQAHRETASRKGQP